MSDFTPRPFKTAGLVYRQVRQVFPLVDRELDHWASLAAAMPDPELGRHALASITNKRFHCLGGAVYALLNRDRTADLVRAIVAIQTVSDYLDNLCDRAGVADEKAFRTLHEAMMASVDLERPLPAGGFYRDYHLKDDGGYLDKLVAASRSVLKTLPGYGVARPWMVRLAGLYSDLQVYKHLPTTAEREGRLAAWHGEHREVGGGGRTAVMSGGGLAWWEFGAASGSTLGIFILLAGASRRGFGAEEAAGLAALYFPAICGLHILLDYFIDQDEDEGRDLNFVSYYPDAGARVEALRRFTHEALSKVSLAGRSDVWFHRAVIEGLLALYLSDPKVEETGLLPGARLLLRDAGATAGLMHRACRALRARGVIT